MVRFETTSLPLAASLLVHVPDATVLSVSDEPSVDGKRLIAIGYPTDQAQEAQSLVQQFHARTLIVPLYTYNRALNVLRDRLKQGTDTHDPR